MNTDTVDKIVLSYFSAINKHPFIYKGKLFLPKPLIVSCSIFYKRMNCLSHCGACCSVFSLDYLPSENLRDIESKERTVEFDGRSISLFSVLQTHKGFCKNLDEEGRCGIHGSHPFSCDFELLRFTHFENHSVFSHRNYGRGWNMKRIDGEKGALCEWFNENSSAQWIEEINRKLKRLQDWCIHFQMENKLSIVMKWVSLGPHCVD